MSEPLSDRTTLILSRSWTSPETELSFVTRALAGAASRSSQVNVIVPAPAGAVRPDGAFDLFGAGIGPRGGFPDPADASWPADLPVGTSLIVDDLDAAARALLERFTQQRPVHTIAPTDAPLDPCEVSPLRFTAEEGSRADSINLHVPINPIAATHRHNALGFTGYLLVLSDRAEAPSVQPPTPMAAWLTARFPTLDVVVIEDATAAVWRGRALRGVVGVYTRTDLWRLLAHARVTVDLAPGAILARECIESLRFGTPIIVPTGSVARAHADAGGGMTFSDYPELLSCVEQLCDESLRTASSSRGRHYADIRYGDQDAFVTSVSRALGVAAPRAREGRL